MRCRGSQASRSDSKHSILWAMNQSCHQPSPTNQRAMQRLLRAALMQPSISRPQSHNQQPSHRQPLQVLSCIAALCEAYHVWATTIKVWLNMSAGAALHSSSCRHLSCMQQQLGSCAIVIGTTQSSFFWILLKSDPGGSFMCEHICLHQQQAQRIASCCSKPCMTPK